MSHTTTIKSVKITNINALKRAVDALNKREGLNLKVRENERVTLWGTGPVCRVVVDVPGVSRGLNVGFQGTEAEGLTPVMDTHGGWIAAKLGAGRELASSPEERSLAAIGKLMHAYAVENVRDVASAANVAVSETYNDETGEMVMQLA